MEDTAKKAMPVKAGDSNHITREYFDALLVEMRHIGAAAPDTSFSLFGEMFQTPIMPAALSHLDGGLLEIAKAAAAVGTPMWMGMGDEKELEELIATGAKTIKIIKPYADNDVIFSKIEHAEKAGALAVGMDLDHAYNRKGAFDTIAGEPMSSKSLAEFASFVKASKLPFILKGVLSERDAEICLKLGVKGMVLSHHHGLMDYAVPPLMLLPKIKKMAGESAGLFVDCSVQTGMDVFKAIALGAKAVSVGRALLAPMKEKGAAGVQEKLEAMTCELRHAMGLTASTDLAGIDAGLIHQRTW